MLEKAHQKIFRVQMYTARTTIKIDNYKSQDYQMLNFNVVYIDKNFYTIYL